MIPGNFFSGRIENINMHDIINRAIEVNRDIIADQNTNQLDKGLDSEGNDLGEYSNFDYKNRWKPVDLKLTGDFRKSINPSVGSDSFSLDASDWKTTMLKKRYGNSILGLSKEGVEVTCEFIKEDMQKIFAEEVRI